MTVKIYIDFDPKGTFEKNIVEAIKKKMRVAAKKLSTDIKDAIKNVIINAIKNSPTYQSLINDRAGLGGDIGDPNIRAKMDAIIKIWSDSFIVKVGRISKDPDGFSLKIIVKGVRKDWQDVINAAQARFIPPRTTDVHSFSNVHVLEWLKWLLKEGSTVINKEYGITINPRKSRTGVKVMGKVKRKRIKPFMIPPEHSGTPRDNFVTRAIDSAEKDVRAEILSVIRKNINAFK